MTIVMRHYKKISKCVATTLPKATKTCLWMLKITLPISLLIRLMQYYGAIDVIGTATSSLFPLLGLPAESAVVFFTSCCLPIYAPIALMATIDLTIRQATILSLMCLVSHNLPVECAIAKKTGSSFTTIFVLRVASSVILATILWLVGNIIGLSYGSAIMINMVSEGKIEKYEADLANRHLAISHSLLEDTVLFASLGVCAWWLLLFRIPLAIIAVWAKRLSDKYMVTYQMAIQYNYQSIIKLAANR